MADVVLVVLRRPEMAVGLLRAAQQIGTLMGDAKLNVLAVRDPIQVTGLAAEALIEEADSIVKAKAEEQQRVAALQGAFENWARETGSDGFFAHVNADDAAIF